MRKTFKAAVDFILYSHIWIALAAGSIALATQLFFTNQITITYKEYFIFFSTLTLYSLHRLIGLQKIHDHLGPNRFQNIRPLRNLLIATIIVAGFISLWMLVKFDTNLLLTLIIPIALSIAYVLPIWRKKRLRDFSYIKVFIIAIVWSLITVLLPLWESPLKNDSIVLTVILIDRFLFILAITIPFDIRDLEVDQVLKVKTIPSKIGLKKSKVISQVCIVISFLLNIILCIWLDLSIPILGSIMCTLLFTSYLVYLADIKNSDYYFSGWLDGTMVIYFLAAYLFNAFSMSIF